MEHKVAEHARNHKIQLLAVYKRESKCLLCLHQQGRGVLSGGDCGSCGVYGRGYRRSTAETILENRATGLKKLIDIDMKFILG